MAHTHLYYIIRAYFKLDFFFFVFFIIIDRYQLIVCIRDETYAPFSGIRRIREKKIDIISRHTSIYKY